MFWARVVFDGSIPKTRLAAACKIHVIKEPGLNKHQRAVGPAGAVCVVLYRLVWQPVSPFVWCTRTCLHFRTEAPSTVLSLIHEAIRPHLWTEYWVSGCSICAHWFDVQEAKTGLATKEHVSAPSPPP